MKKSLTALVGLTLAAGLAGGVTTAQASSTLVVSPMKTARGTVVVKVTGVPAKAKPRVIVRGPGSYKKSIRVSGRKATLTGLQKGRYTVRANAVSVSGNVSLPISRKVTVKVTKKRGAVARIYYSATGTR